MAQSMKEEVMYMKKGYLLVDYIFDFIDDQGVLSLGQRGQAIASNILKVIGNIKENHDALFVCSDNHEEEVYALSPESNLFPLHCCNDGNCLVLDEGAYTQVKPEITFNISKNMYSSFNGTRLELLLRQLDIREVVIMGVCTDICVLHTAIDAYNRGFKLVVLSDCCCGLTDEGHAFALNHFKNTLGAKVMTSDEWLAR